MQAYSRVADIADSGKLPDLEIFEMTAREVAEGSEWEDTIIEYSRTYEYRLAAMNGEVREAMFDAMIEQHAIKGGWFYWYCFPGCMPEGEPNGPFESADEALEAAREDAADE